MNVIMIVIIHMIIDFNMTSSLLESIEEIFDTICTELCKNIPAKFQKSPSKCSAPYPQNALRRNISASYSRNLVGVLLHYHHNAF